MSSSPLLTITESHGFCALLASIITIIGAICMFGRELRNLACGTPQLAESEAGLTFWARVLQSRDVVAREVPVLWFDTSGGREGPTTYGRPPCLSPVYCKLSYSLVRPPAIQQAPAGRGWSSFRT